MRLLLAAMALAISMGDGRIDAQGLNAAPPSRPNLGPGLPPRPLERKCPRRLGRGFCLLGRSIQSRTRSSCLTSHDAQAGIGLDRGVVEIPLQHRAVVKIQPGRCSRYVE